MWERSGDGVSSHIQIGNYFLYVKSDQFGKWDGVVEVSARDIVMVFECDSEEDAQQELLKKFVSNIKASILGKQLLLNSVNELIKKE